MNKTVKEWNEKELKFLRKIKDMNKMKNLIKKIYHDWRNYNMVKDKLSIGKIFF